MNRLAWIVGLLAIGCGSDPQNGGADASADVATEKATACAVDFPCTNPWGCVDSTHWVEMHSVAKPPCVGLMCESTGVTHACDPGLECVANPAPQSTVPCAYGGRDGCLPADAGAFAPQPIGATPTKQPGACTQPSIDDFWTFCLDPTTTDTTKCGTFANLYKACAQCLATTVTTVDTGAQGFLWVPNVGGCYAALDGTSAPGSCAAKGDANMQCAVAACKDGCLLYPDGFDACVAASRKTACAAFPICDGDAGASYATCEPATAKDFVVGFGSALCGP